MVQVTDKACRAAFSHDSPGLYQAIRTLTPKQTRKTVRFRDDQGNLLSPVEELQLLEQYFQAIFQTERVALPFFHTHALVLTPEELERQLSELKENKAIAPNPLPTILVKNSAGSLAQWLHTFLATTWTTRPMIPQCWKDAKLTLLPTDLRPIALTDPVGKAVLGHYARKVKEAMLPTLVQILLLAYLSGRSIAKARSRYSPSVQASGNNVPGSQPVHRSRNSPALLA